MTTGSAFALHISTGDGTRLVRATGRLVAGAGAEAQAWALATAIGDVDYVVLDLRDVTAIDAGGVGRLVGLRQSLGRRGSRLSIARASARVTRVLHLTALDAIFGIAPGSLRSSSVTQRPSAAA
jgi:anti-anti-sigma factor